MKQYLISEEELIQCIKDWTQQGYVPAYFIRNSYLKSKKPVEIIAEGECLINNIEGVMINNKSLAILIAEYNGKSGTLIFIPKE